MVQGEGGQLPWQTYLDINFWLLVIPYVYLRARKTETSVAVRIIQSTGSESRNKSGCRPCVSEVMSEAGQLTDVIWLPGCICQTLKMEIVHVKSDWDALNTNIIMTGPWPWLSCSGHLTCGLKQNRARMLNWFYKAVSIGVNRRRCANVAEMRKTGRVDVLDIQNEKGTLRYWQDCKGIKGL